MAKRNGCIGLPIGHHDEWRPLRDGHRRTHGHAENQLTTGGATGLANLRVGSSVGSEKSVPEKVNHCEIAVRVEMVDEVKLLLAPEPSQACKARPFDVVFLVKIYVRAALAAIATTNRSNGRTRNIPLATRIVGMRK